MNFTTSPASGLSLWLDEAERLLAKPAPRITVIVVVILLGMAVSLQHVSDELWQDEAATLLRFASKGILYPFLHYDAPNNHVLFSALTSAWIQLAPGGISLPWLRLLPICLFLASLPVSVLVGRRLGGHLAGAIAGVTFALSPVAAGFAAQLRGYGPSWLFLLLMVLWGTRIAGGERMQPRHLAGYVLTAIGSVALLPSNLVFAGAIAISLVVAGSCAGHVKSLRTVSWLLGAPLAGLLVYLPIWREVLAAVGSGTSAWTSGSLLADWLVGAVKPVGFLSAWAILGALAIARQSIGESHARVAFGPLLAALLVAGFVLAVSALPGKPFPRILSPFLPAWYCAVATLAVQGLAALARQRLAPVLALLAAFTGSWAGAQGPQCGPPPNAGPYAYTLCYQYFHDRFHPSKVIDAWAQLEVPGLPIVTDYEGAFALRVLGSPAPVFHVSEYDPSRGGPPLLVAHDAVAMASLATSLGLDPGRFAEISNTGYFRVYAYGPPNGTDLL